MNILTIPRAALIASVLLVLAPLVVPGWIVFVMTKALFMSIAVMGVAVLLRGGLLTFGHALYYATGAYAVGFSVKWLGVHELMLLIPLGALAGLLMAALVGLIMARYREVFFAMLNLAFSMMLFGALLKFYPITGGTDGLSIGTATLFGSELEGDSLGFYYFSLAIVGIVCFIVCRFMASPLGYFLRALYDNEIRMEYSGVAVRQVVYRTYLLAGTLGGVSGVLAAFSIGHIVPEDAFWIQSGEFVFVALLGGFGGVPGPLMGAFVFEFIQTYASKYFPLAWQMTLGIIMLVVILFQPGGLWAIYKKMEQRLGGKGKGDGDV
ncbi:MAG: branched-chain amino acid ABC transporter permease [Rhodospirillaceae bacterium]|jgi:branched-chain amino acid transport system permease protein|nr:branched-chain amino acid ABC transporter permease [Rhodospirillaceae bacterium]MBT5456909.1 branched-chain amino acid ABC transporter permease [Rhodospirillaceae bacterium]